MTSSWRNHSRFYKNKDFIILQILFSRFFVWCHCSKNFSIRYKSLILIGQFNSYICSLALNVPISSCTVLIKYSRQFINFFWMILDSKSPHNRFQIAYRNAANIFLIQSSEFTSRNSRTDLALGKFRNQIAKCVFCFKKSGGTGIFAWLKILLFGIMAWSPHGHYVTCVRAVNVKRLFQK